MENQSINVRKLSVTIALLILPISLILLSIYTAFEGRMDQKIVPILGIIPIVGFLLKKKLGIYTFIIWWLGLIASWAAYIFFGGAIAIIIVLVVSALLYIDFRFLYSRLV